MIRHETAPTFHRSRQSEAAAVEVGAAGDIATSGTGDTQTSNRVLAIDPALVLTLGDHAYPSGTLSQFNAYYDPTWGRFKAITPSPGNHDWLTSGAAGYESYFGVQAGHIRSFVVGDWRVISMDSYANRSSQNAALATALRNDGRRCELLYFHHPRWSSSHSGNDSRVGPWWTTGLRALGWMCLEWPRSPLRAIQQEDAVRRIRR